MAGYVALEIEQYASWNRTITVKGSTGVPQNLVGSTANTLMRKSFYTTKANTIETLITDGANGLLTLQMSAANTGNLTPGRYVYDVTLTSNTGSVQRVIEGIIVVNPGVTR
jgi:hypothetical protein